MDFPAQPGETQAVVVRTLYFAHFFSIHPFYHLPVPLLHENMNTLSYAEKNNNHMKRVLYSLVLGGRTIRHLPFLKKDFQSSSKQRVKKKKK